jgi:hypothetical protein
MDQSCAILVGEKKRLETKNRTTPSPSTIATQDEKN